MLSQILVRKAHAKFENTDKSMELNFCPYRQVYQSDFIAKCTFTCMSGHRLVVIKIIYAGRAFEKVKISLKVLAGMTKLQYVSQLNAK